MLSNDTITLNTHNLITGCLRQFLDTGREIFSIYVIFPVQSSGLVQIFKFYCASIIKMKKKLNYLVKPHERCQFGIFLCQCLFLEKIRFATLSNIPNYSFSLSKLFPKSLVVLFFTKAFKTNVFQVLSVDLDFFHWKNVYSPKNDFISTFNSFVLACFCRPGASFCWLAIWRLTPKKEVNNMTNPFWDRVWK